MLDYDASEGLLYAPQVAVKLKVKAIVQFSTSTPRQTRNAEVRVMQYASAFLDAA